MVGEEGRWWSPSGKQVLKKLNIELPYDRAVPLRCMYAPEIGRHMSSQKLGRDCS